MTAIFIFLFGLIMGSFLSMLTYRLPRGLSFKGRSFCDNCKKNISWRENVPLLSYLWQAGKCRHCKIPISYRYPLIEGLTGVIFLFVYYANLARSSSLLANLSYLFGNWSFLWLGVILGCLIALLVIDLELQILPDRILQILFLLILVFILQLPNPEFFNHLFAGFACFSFFLLIYLITKEKGMGFGDVKLAFVLGFLLGFPHSLVWLFLAFVGGSIIGLVLMVFRIVSLGKAMPFGPFLVSSAIIALLFGDSLYVWYLQLISSKL